MSLVYFSINSNLFIAIYKLIKDFDFYENNEEPILEIVGFDTRTGNNEYLKLEWRK
jgi:hypothetical protein